MTRTVLEGRINMHRDRCPSNAANGDVEGPAHTEPELMPADSSKSHDAQPKSLTSMSQGDHPPPSSAATIRGDAKVPTDLESEPVPTDTVRKSRD
jgi:hypothetical protein